MKKILLALVLALGITGATAHHETPIQALYEWGDTYVWSVKHLNEDGTKDTGYMSHGSGVWLDDTTMVTACHVTSGEDVVFATFNEHDEISVDLAVEFCNQWKDQSVMSVIVGVQRHITPVVFGAIPERGERLYIIGFPADNPITVTTGWFVGKSVRDVDGYEDNESWSMTADAAGGNSGGAVVVIRDGEIQLVGILVSGYSGGNITQMKSLEYTKAWLAKLH